MDKTAMHLAYENHFGRNWGEDPEDSRDEQVWAAAWHALRGHAICEIERDILPQMGRQNRGVKLCLDVLVEA